MLSKDQYLHNIGVDKDSTIGPYEDEEEKCTQCIAMWSLISKILKTCFFMILLP